LETLKTNVVLPKDLIKHIDEVAGRRRRSEFLTQAAKEKLARMRFERAADKAFGSWKDENHLDIVSDEDMEGYLRRIREATNKRIQNRLN